MTEIGRTTREPNTCGGAYGVMWPDMVESHTPMTWRPGIGWMCRTEMVALEKAPIFQNPSVQPPVSTWESLIQCGFQSGCIGFVHFCLCSRNTKITDADTQILLFMLGKVALS